MTNRGKFAMGATRENSHSSAAKVYCPRSEVFARPIRGFCLVFVSTVALMSCAPSGSLSDAEFSDGSEIADGGELDRRAEWSARLVPIVEPSLAPLVARALTTNEWRSAARSLIEQRMAESLAISRGRWPQLEPVASINQEGDASVGFGLSIPVVDFGRDRARVEQANAAILVAEIEYWIERNEAVGSALEHVAGAAEALALHRETQESLSRVRTLQSLARERVASGVADRSELELITLRVAELENQSAEDAANLQLALSLLSEELDQSISATNVPELDLLLDALDSSRITAPPPLVLRSQFEEERSELYLEQVRAERLPRIVLQANATHDGADPNTAATLSLASSSSIFSARANIEAARSALSVARSETLRAVERAESERDRLEHERNRFIQQAHNLAALIAQSRRSAELFEEQHSVGSRPLTDGITVLRTLLQAERDLIAARSGLARILIRHLVLDGRLAQPAQVAVE